VDAACTGRIVLSHTRKSNDLQLIDLSCEKLLVSLPISPQLQQGVLVYNPFSGFLFQFINDRVYKTHFRDQTLTPVDTSISVSTSLVSVAIAHSANIITAFELSSASLHVVDLENTKVNTMYFTGYSQKNNKFNSNWITYSEKYVYAILQRISDGTDCIVSMEITTGNIVVLASAVNSNIEGVFFRNDALYAIFHDCIYAVRYGGIMELTYNLPTGFTVSQIYASHDDVFLSSTNDDIIWIGSELDIATDVTPSRKPYQLSNEDISVLGFWNPSITSMSPSSASLQQDTTSVTVYGRDISFGLASKIYLFDDYYKLTYPLVSCDNGEFSCFTCNAKFEKLQSVMNLTVYHSVGSDLLVQRMNNAPSFILYQNLLTRMNPTHATADDIVSVIAPFYPESTNIICTFRHMDRSANTRVTLITTGKYLDSTSIRCPVPLFNGTHNERIEVTISVNSQTFVDSKNPVYFYFLKPKVSTYYESFDSQESITQSFVPATAVPGNQGTPQQLQVILASNTTTRTLLEFNSEFDTSNANQQRRAIQTKAKYPVLNQQVFIEFYISSTSTAPANYLELWVLLDADTYIYSSVSMDFSNKYQITSKYSLKDNGNVYHASESSPCSFQRNVLYQMAFTVVAQNSKTMKIEAQLISGTSAICSVIVIPHVSFDIFSTVLSSNFSVVMSQSTIEISRRTTFNKEATTSITTYVDRTGVQCTACNTDDTTTIANTKGGQSIGTLIIAIVSSVVGSAVVLGIILICIFAVLLFIVYKSKNSRYTSGKQTVHNAWEDSDDNILNTVSRKVFETYRNRSGTAIMLHDESTDSSSNQILSYKLKQLERIQSDNSYGNTV
jgi:hypothetical protein